MREVEGGVVNLKRKTPSVSVEPQLDPFHLWKIRDSCFGDDVMIIRANRISTMSLWPFDFR